MGASSQTRQRVSPEAWDELRRMAARGALRLAPRVAFLDVQIPRRALVGSPVAVRWQLSAAATCELRLNGVTRLRSRGTRGEHALPALGLGRHRIQLRAWPDEDPALIAAADHALEVHAPPVTVAFDPPYLRGEFGRSVTLHWHVQGAQRIVLYEPISGVSMPVAANGAATLTVAYEAQIVLLYAIGADGVTHEAACRISGFQHQTPTATLLAPLISAIPELRRFR